MPNITTRNKHTSDHLLRLYRYLRPRAFLLLQDIAVTIENLLPESKRSDRLVILDDVFPHLLSPFRIAEYNSYLAAWKDTIVYSHPLSFPALGETRSFRKVRNEYLSRFPQFKGRVLRFNRRRRLRGALAYFMFIHNTYYFLDVIERSKIPFVFTLYPGGGFKLGEEDSDVILRRVCSSQFLRKIIVTQSITQKYLLDNNFIDAERVELIYGGVFPSDQLLTAEVPRKRYKGDKETFDICFVAHKYMKGGVDKGYDLFVEVARLLSQMHPDIFFHVVGPFGPDDIDAHDIEERMTFYGPQQTHFFPDFYSRMDIILSPNVPFVLLPGAFDGFPTGSCIEAGLCGVAVFCTDSLGQNVVFRDGEEIVIISRDAAEIAVLIDKYYHSYDELCYLADQGQAAFRRVFDIEAQMAPRLRILSECMT